jgi:DNA-directed RNA polymerase subunit RPC12/RpoP
MITSIIHCQRCGSANLRRSRRKSKFEWLKMGVGTYPFRCIDCNNRFPVNVWLFSKLAFAKCPKCLGVELSGWPNKKYRLPFWKNLLITFGAHRYRCATCRHRFLSFRAAEHGHTHALEPEQDAAAESAHSSELEGLEQVSQSQAKS